MLRFKSNRIIKYVYGLPLALYFICVLFSISSCNTPFGNSNAADNKVIDSAFQIYKVKDAKRYLDSVPFKFTNLDLRHKYLYYSLSYGYYLKEKNDYQRAMAYADSIINLYNTPEKQSKYINDYYQGFYLKGDVYFNENKYDEAYKYFYEGKLIANKSASPCALADFSYRMGMVLYKQEHFKLAAANFKNSFNETGACNTGWGYFYRRQEVLDNIALCYRKINEADSALNYFKKGLDFIDKWAISFPERKDMLNAARAVIYGNEATVYINKNNLNAAKALLKKSTVINLLKGNDNGDAELSELKLAHIYFNTNQLDSLKNLLVSIKGQFDSVKTDKVEADWNYLAGYYYLKKGDSKSAVNYLVKYISLNDSIVNRDKTLKAADISQKIKGLENNYEFASLKKSNELQDSYLKITVVFVVMLLIIILLIMLTWQKSRKNIETLGRLNQKINEQNKNLENTLAKLNLSSQEKDRILRTVAHDLRNPLGGIASLTLAMEGDNYNDDQLEMINLIKETSKNSLELINEILEATNEGKDNFNKELVEINGLVNLSVELLRFKAAEKQQEIRLNQLEKPEEIYISKEKIWRVISNLISNAIKFSPVGTPIYVNLVNLGAAIEISVKDKGIGIPESLKNKVFNMFTEAKRPGTAGEKSFGLGLSISKQIIENHNGKIWFESEINKGTTFFVRLPQG